MTDPDALRFAAHDALQAAGHPDLAGIVRDAADEIGRLRMPLDDRMPRGWLVGRIILDASPGCHIEWASRYMAAIAGRVGRAVEMRFNEVELVCRPGDEAGAVLDAYNRWTRGETP